MVEIGKRSTLRVVRMATPGAYLDGEQLGEILLPGCFVPPGTIGGEVMDVFIHCDSADRLVATTETPHAMAGEFALLRVVSVNPRMGAFLDWGLGKDLLLPNREQTAERVRVGAWVLVYVLVDPSTQRLVASARLNRFLDLTAPSYTEGQRVQLLVMAETSLGYKAVIEDAHVGLLYRSDLSSALGIGQKLSGYVRKVRDDGKIDLALDQAGYKRVAPLAEQIVEALLANGGRLPYGDHSSPEEIRAFFGVSKKAFKQAIGALFREKRLNMETHGIRLLDTWARKPEQT